MIRLQEVLAMARVELRLSRRLVRYWVFLGLAYLIAIVAFLYYSLLHMLASSWSGTAALIGPRFLMGPLGTYAVLVFVVGIIFLGFDVRARDVRERMVEVLDARPCTNLELVSGRFLGLLLACWVPVGVLAVLLQLLGFLLRALGAPLGEPIEPWSLLTLVFFMSLPAMVFSLALVFVVTLAVRNRLIAAVTLIGCLGLLVWATFRMRLPLLPLVDLTGGFGLGFPSDMVPGLDPVGALQRVGVLVAGLGLLVLAAAIHPRLDEGSRPRSAAAALAVLLLGGLLVGGAAGLRLRDVHRLEAWRKVHEAKRSEPAPDLDTITGSVRVEPGRRLGLDLEVAFRAPVNRGLASALFAFNPGLAVRSVKGPGGADLPFTQSDGLLEVRLERPLAAGETSSLHLVADGSPDTLFGYLDAAKLVENLTTRDSQIFLLGDLRGMFSRRFVALMPGIRWLPAGGSDVGREDLKVRPTDFFTVDLEVEVPQGFLVAGPGRRQEVASEGDRVRFRFNPQAPLPEVALVAGRFSRRSAEVEGVQLEVLVDPGHTRNLDFFADAGDEIRRAIGDRLKGARDAGLPYPYDALTMVEVPSRLRGFGGGWRLDTTFGPPGLLLVRENAFPTARFDVAFRDAAKVKEREGGLPRAKRERLEAHFLNDFSGGNVFMNASRAFVLDQTAARGAEGVAVNFVLETLTTRLVTGTRGYFSVHIFDVDLNQSVQRAFIKFFVGGREGQDFASVVIDSCTSRSEVWEAVLGAALSDLDLGKEPRRTLDVLTLKAGALADSLLDSLGRERAGTLLAALVAHHRGQTFTRADLVAEGAAVGGDLGPLLAYWLDGTELPGFVGGGARAFRLPDSSDGSPRYQLLVTVRNDEAVPGMLRVARAVGSGDEVQRDASDPITVGGRSAVEYGTVLSQPPTEVEVRPYLSLNRAPFAVALAKVDEATIVREAPFEGVRPLAWAPPPADVVVVDDLDPGFAVKGDAARSGFRLGRRAASGDTDQGLPVQLLPSPPSEWSRREAAEAWGKYRHTMAFIRSGRGDRRAVFTAALPRPGRFDLEVHLPSTRSFAPFVQKWGKWSLEVVTPGGRQAASFDSAAGNPGWNLVGAYELPAGQVAVELSDATDGQVVVADAIRWTPSAGEKR